MDRPGPVKRALFALLLVACGGPSASGPTPAVDPGAEPAPTSVELHPPGSRFFVMAPHAERIPHTLRYRAGPLELRFSDATVEPGAEPGVAEIYLAQLTEDQPGQITHRPFVLDGAEGLQITIRSPRARVRALTLWRNGSISRLSVVHRPEDAGLAERVIESLRFDASLPLDPRAALGLDADPVEGLPLLRVSTEQMLFREGGHAVPFPSPEAALDVVYVPYGDERPDERARGHLLGSRFRGISIDPPRVQVIDGARFEGFAMQTRASVGGTELALMGAYFDLPHGALLIRASVAFEREPEWAPRFASLLRSLRER